MAVATGKKIPDFTSASTSGEFRLSRAGERSLVLYFYPKDNTPGCTTETTDFGRLHPRFEAAGWTILGVSRDSLKSHENFRTKLGLPFDLLSDPDESLCELFGVMKMKNMYGKQVRGIERSTFLIGPDRKLVQEWRGVKVPGHAEAVLEACLALRAA